jgi:tetratricopeptide (TPR) repeat protein
MSVEQERDVATEGDETRAPDVASTAQTSIGAPDEHDALTTRAYDSDGRYELLDEIARGGMGAVLRANDRTLGREVAVKVLQERFPVGSMVARRFVDEARITGQLQHPGIPPVHDLGTLPDGRPFLAMKLIKGETLDDLLDDRPDPVADRGRFLAVFEGVCQAVAYAHARHVIHRDLKPANVMVGAFGEVQVMDWGLAKVLTDIPSRRPADSDDALATEIRSARDTDGSETQAGSVLGTPAYMAPEQAIGAIDQVDERSDVFGLGAILAVILSGEPPFVGDTAEGSRVMAARGKVEDCFVRLDASGAEPELTALCKKCLSPERDDRPASGAAVAAAVAELRADAEERARRAELDRVRVEGERARAEAEARLQRQKRRSQLAAAGGAVGLLVVVAGAWLVVRVQSEARRADADRVASVALGRAEQLVSQADAIDASDVATANAVARLWEQAEAAIVQAEGAIAGVGSVGQTARVRDRAESVRSGSARARRDAALLASLESARAADWGTSGAYLDRRESVRMYRTAFATAGLPAGGDAATLADAVRAEPPGVRKALEAALDDWVDALQLPPDREAGRVRAAADLVDPDPIRKEVRAVVAGGDKQTIVKLAERLGSADLPPAAAVILGAALDDKGCASEAVRILRPLRERHPSDLPLLRELCAALQGASPNDPVVIEEAVGCAWAAVAAHPNAALGRYALGQSYHSGNKDLAAAEIHYRKTLELNPRFTHCMINLAIILKAKGDSAGEEALLRRAIETDPQFGRAHHNLGDLLFSRGDLAGAEAEFRKAIELDPENYVPNLREKLAAVKRTLSLMPRLDDVAAGRTIPSSPTETVEFARLCREPFVRRYAAAVRLFDQAFAGDPKLAEDLAAAHRYSAACYAALAADGQGADAPAEPARRAALRGQALVWLRAHLVALAKLASSDQSADRMNAVNQLSWWLQDADLISVRPGTARYNLPAAERPAWDALWADVRATIAQAQKPATAAPAASKP